jgi:formylglycine-generating enzyme required for sulfatase activity
MMKFILICFLVFGFIFNSLLMTQQKNYTNSIGMEFVYIPAGSFMMGTKKPICPKDDPFTEKNEYEDCMNAASHDNVREWCQDRYDNKYYLYSPSVDPISSSGSDRSMRGGTFQSAARSCTSAHRGYDKQSSRYINRGFRIALSPSQL